ncbi:MAG: ABC transporter ATP-binding protein [Bacilli bacterium]|jgi:putative ABC transport system ATP-binding protein|nr:ABC transporter ATP-binding protein [Bacilli bacterium]
MLQLKNISFAYIKDNNIFENINLSFEADKIYAIQGLSGSGKSTLLNIIAGLDNRYQGQLMYDNQEINHLNITNYKKDDVSMIFQDQNLLHYLNILDNIKLECLIKHKIIDETLLNKYLGQFNLSNLNLKKYPRILSGGQQQRITLIRSLLSGSKIILADEPTANVDEETAFNIINEFKYLAHQEHKIIIIVTHNNQIASLCDVTYLLKDGLIMEKEHLK